MASSSSSTVSSEPSTPLSELLSALASGVRSSSRLPVNDDYDFVSSLPEVATALEGAQSELLELLQDILTQVQQQQQQQDGSRPETTNHANDHYADLDDPLLWEDCVDACEFLLEHAQAHLTSDGSLQQREHLQQLSRHGQSQLASMTQQNSADIPKPQLSWQNWTPPNERTKVFVPTMTTKPFASVQALDLSLREGHGLETRFGSLRNAIASPTMVGM